jgi:hypothetical protein
MIPLYLLIRLTTSFILNTDSKSVDQTQCVSTVQNNADSLRISFLRSSPFVITDTTPQSGKWSGFLVDCLHGCFPIAADLIVNRSTKRLVGKLVISALSIQDILDTCKAANKGALEGLYFLKDEVYTLSGHVTADSIYFNIDTTVITTDGVDRFAAHYRYSYRGKSIKIDNPRYWEVVVNSLPKYSIAGEYESTNLLSPRLKGSFTLQMK